MPAPRRVQLRDSTFRTVAVTEEGMMRMARDSREDFLRALKGEKPKSPVNLEVLKP